MAPRGDGPFFVGYMAMPRPLAIFCGVASVVMVGLLIGAGIAIGTVQHDPGDAGFMGRDTATGWMVLDPYPVLHVPPSEEYPDGRAIIFSGNGKIGIRSHAAKLEGLPAEVTGARLLRPGAGLEMLQAGGNNIKPAEASALADFAPPERVSVGTLTLKGEIVDSKCYLGAMRPGQGKTHMACANLCIIGDVPPVLVVHRPDGPPDYLLLAGPDGKAVPSEVLDATSIMVEVTGEVFRQGLMIIMAVDPASIREL